MLCRSTHLAKWWLVLTEVGLSEPGWLAARRSRSRTMKFAIPEGRVAKGYTFEVLVSPNSGYHPANRAGRVPLLI